MDISECKSQQVKTKKKYAKEKYIYINKLKNWGFLKKSQ